MENQIEIIEYKQQRLLTTEQLAEFYGVSTKQIQQNFGNNKEKFIEGKHYFYLKGKELQELKMQFENFELVNPKASHLLLYTKQGASRHSKMLGTEKAWDMFDELEENYFNPAPQAALASPRDQLRIMYQFQEDTAERVDDLEKDVNKLKTEQPIAPGDYNYIKTRVNQRVNEVAKGFGKLTNKQRGELYRDINGGIKKITGVGCRTQLRKCHYQIVVDYIQDWEPATATKTILRQMALELGDE